MSTNTMLQAVQPASYPFDILASSNQIIPTCTNFNLNLDSTIKWSIHWQVSLSVCGARQDTGVILENGINWSHRAILQRNSLICPMRFVAEVTAEKASFWIAMSDATWLVAPSGTHTPHLPVHVHLGWPSITGQVVRCRQTGSSICIRLQSITSLGGPRCGH